MKRVLIAISICIALVAMLLVACQKTPAPELASVRERICIDCRDDSYIWGGADMYFYSDDHATNTILMEGSQGLVVIEAPTAVGTATPVMVIDNNGAVANSFEVRKNATPVFYVDVDGNVTYTGMTSAGGLISAAVGVAAPTAVGTATPAFYADSLGVSNLFEVRDAATPVASWANGGAFTFTGAGTYSSGQTVNSWAKVGAPTAIATATPAMVVDSLGVSNILEVRDAATPVAYWTAAGAFTNLTAATLGTFLSLTGQTNITVTDDMAIAPTGSNQPLTAAAAVGATLEASCTAGKIVFLRNVGANAITITDTTTTMLAGNAALGQYDSLTVLCDGTNWVELARSNN